MANRVEIDKNDYPHARCNDDTQATYYLLGAGPEVPQPDWGQPPGSRAKLARRRDRKSVV